ncbi:hypothetical protein REPUB_Repub15cG0029400 [Reevesia pubescens]
MSSSTEGYFEISSYKLISSSFPVEFDYEGESILCNFNVKASRWTSWTISNPGRRFYGCAKYPGLVCGFHTWYDPKLSDQARKMMNELKIREKHLFEKVQEMKNDVSKLKKNVVDLVEAEIIEENLLLKREVKFIRLKLRECIKCRWKWIVVIMLLCHVSKMF